MLGKRYTYRFVKTDGRPAGPYLPVRLVNPIDKVASVWNFLVDTGADCCLFECLGHDDFPPLLGVADFLRHFKVTLDYPHETITLEW